MLNATLATRLDIDAGLCIIRVRPDAGVPPFQPGQFVRLGLPDNHDHPETRAAHVEGTVAVDAAGRDILAGGADDRDRDDAGPGEANGSMAGSKPGAAGQLIRRAYSIVSAPNDPEGLEIYVVKVREGCLTPEIWELDLGDRLWVDPKIQGDFTLESVVPDRDLVMVATGTGIAPYISMLRTYAGAHRWRRFTVVHGVRRVTDLGYREELEGAARRNPNIRYVPIVSRDAEARWPGMRGRALQALEPALYETIAGAPLDPAEVHVFLCGNPDMVHAARAQLEPRGFVLSTKHRPGNLHAERFW